MFVSRKAVNTLIIAPLLGMAVLTAQPITFGGDSAYAQTTAGISSFATTTQRPTRGGPTNNNGGGENFLDRAIAIPPCRPGAAASPNCRPWTPPTVVVESEEECQCQMRRVNGVMMKDCYVMLRNLVHYCKAGHLVRN